MKTLVLGLGNPLLTDDGVGLRVARALRIRLVGRPDVVVALTNSPVLRAAALDLLGRDIGEPPWITGLVISVESDRKMSVDVFGVEDR